MSPLYLFSCFFFFGDNLEIDDTLFLLSILMIHLPSRRKRGINDFLRSPDKVYLEDTSCRGDIIYVLNFESKIETVRATGALLSIYPRTIRENDTLHGIHV